MEKTYNVYETKTHALIMFCVPLWAAEQYVGHEGYTVESVPDCEIIWEG